MTVTISHITHISNLPSIIEVGCLWSDAKRIELAFASQNIGYKHIKDRRMARPVRVAAGGTLGQYVPFNFCPRSVMLYVISQGHDDYSGGQDEVVHLLSSVESVRSVNDNCFFTDLHADLAYAEQIDDFSRLHELDLQRIRTEQYWAEMKEEKQAEFLAYESVPWACFDRIGVKSEQIKQRLVTMLDQAEHKPRVLVTPDWYY